jgi:SAM-dependent methyltransferase
MTTQLGSPYDATAVAPPRTPAPARPARVAIGLPEGVALDVPDQDERKYGTTNPVVRALIARLVGALQAEVGSDPGLLIDVGVGEGLALARVAPGVPAVGVEYRMGKLRAAARRLDALHPLVGDAGELPLRDGSGDTVTCFEVLEHLQPFEPAVAELARITRGRCIVSVPWEPWFRLGNLARGKNLRRAGNDVEHVQQFRPATLDAALRRGFGEVEIRPCFPWLVAVARRPVRRR